MKSILLKSIVALFLLATIPSVSNARNVTNEASIPPFLLNTLNMMFNVSAKVKIRANVVDFASKFLGTPYRSGGTSPKGFDCSGFVGYVFNEYGYDLAHSSRTLSTIGVSVKKEEAGPGDLVFFAAGGRVHHVAIVYSNYNNDLKIIHSSNSKGVTIDAINSSAYWSSRFYSIKRII